MVENVKGYFKFYSIVLLMVVGVIRLYKADAKTVLLVPTLIYLLNN